MNHHKESYKIIFTEKQILDIKKSQLLIYFILKKIEIFMKNSNIKI